MTFKKDCSQLHVLREQVEVYIQKLPMDNKRRMRMVLCVDEAAANIMEHGEAAEGEGELTFWVTLCCQDGFIKVIFIDNGKPFDPTQAPLVDIKTHIRSGNKGGLGVHIMRTNMDIFQYDRKDDKNYFTLGSTICPEPKEET